MHLDWRSVRFECLGLAAALATLPISEPALHSLYTLAPERFARWGLPFLVAALLAALVGAIALAAGARLARRRARPRARHTQGSPSSTGAGDPSPQAARPAPSPAGASVTGPAPRALAGTGVPGPAPSPAGASVPGPAPHALARALVMVALLLAGTAGLWAALWVDLPTPAIVACGAASGLGSTLLLVAWARLYRARCRDAALAHVALSVALGGLLMNTLGTMPPALACALFFALQLVALAIPTVALRTPGPARQVGAAVPDAPLPDPAGGASGPETPSPASGAGALALAGLALYGLSFPLLGAHGTLYLYLSFLLWTIVIGVVLWAALLRGTRSSAETKVPAGVVLPLAAWLALAVVLATPGGAHSIPGRIALTGFFALAAILCLATVVGAPRPPVPAAIATFAASSLLGLTAQVALSPDVAGRILSVLALAYACCLSTRAALAGLRPRASSTQAQVKPGTPAGTSASSPAPIPAASPSTWPSQHTPQASAWPTTPQAADPGAPSVRTPAPALDDARLAELARDLALTARETEIVRLLAAGASWGAIAERLVISESTARGHAHKVYQKAGVSTREELLAFLADARTERTRDGQKPLSSDEPDW